MPGTIIRCCGGIEPFSNTTTLEICFRRTKIDFCKDEPMCFYQFSKCFLVVLRHNYLFRGNQVAVDNLMLLLLGRKMYARVFWDLFVLIRILRL